MSIATDSNNNVYITGYTYGALDGTNQGSGDAFVVKFDSDGTEVWRTQLGTSEEDQAYGIATDSDNNVYITGITEGALGGTNLGSNDIFVVKFDTDGTEVWRKQLGTSGTDRANEIATDSNNNVYITGYTYGDLDGTNQGGSEDAFVVKYDSDGDKKWTKQLGTSGSEQANDIAIDSNNNVYITGMTAGDLGGTNQGSNDAFVVKFDSDGTETWRTLFGSTGVEFVWSLAIDLNDNVYIAGMTPGDLGGTNQGSFDVFVVKYSEEQQPEPEPEPISITISLTKGINSIYITKDGNLTNVTGLYIYEYDGIYSNALNILEGSVNISTGSYFIKTNVTTDITYNYQGELPTSINIDVTQGWNVIGWNSNNINLRATLTDNTNIIETNTLQIYETINNIYTLESDYSNLNPNVAYWVKCNGSGQLIITPNT